MKIASVGLKGFVKDSGIWAWTPEVLLEHDALYPELTASQKAEIAKALEDARQVLKGTVEGWNAEERAAKAAQRTSSPEERPVKVPPVNPAVVHEHIANHRKAGDEYNKDAHGWNHCVCGNTDINRTSAAGKPYQCCDECGLFLNPDGTVKAKGGAK